MKKTFFTALCGLFALLAFAERKTPTTVIMQVTDPQMGFYTDNRDMVYETEARTRIVEAINRNRPDAGDFTGEYVHDTDNEGQWIGFLRIIAGIDPRIRTAYVPGNHDVHVINGSVDTAPYERHLGADRFHIRVKNVLLTGINSGYLKDGTADPAIAERQFRWLEKTLSRKRDHEVSILFAHHPFFLERIDEPEGYSTLAPEVRRNYFRLFEETGVDAVFTGHLHDNAATEYRGIPMIVTGPAGRPLGEAPSGLRIITVRDGTIHHRYYPIDDLPADRTSLE